MRSRPPAGAADRAAGRLHRLRPAVDGPVPAGLPAAGRRPGRQPGRRAADADRRRHRDRGGSADARPDVRCLGSAPAADRLDPGLRGRLGAVRPGPSAALLVVWRFVQGASGGGGIVLARAIAADVASGVAAARLFSLFMTISSVAPIVAPVIGGLMLAWTGQLAADVLPAGRHQPGAGRRRLAVDPGDTARRTRHRGGLRQTGRGFRRAGPGPGVRRVRADGRLRLRLAVRLHLRRRPSSCRTCTD